MKVDNTLPGFAYDYVKGILKKAEIHDKFDLCETLLQLGGSQDCEGKQLILGYIILISIIYCRILFSTDFVQIFVLKVLGKWYMKLCLNVKKIHVRSCMNINDSYSSMYFHGSVEINKKMHCPYTVL